jgi:hypothetical protein
MRYFIKIAPFSRIAKNKIDCKQFFFQENSLYKNSIKTRSTRLQKTIRQEISYANFSSSNKKASPKRIRGGSF